MSQLRRFDDHHLPIYSSFLGWMETSPLRLAPARQWLATLRNAKGLRREEFDRTRLASYLERVPPDEKLDKSFLVGLATQHLDECRPVLLTERITSYQPDLQIEAFDPGSIPKMVNEQFRRGKIVRTCMLTSFKYRIIGATFQDMFGSSTGWFIYDNHWRPIPPSGGYTNSLDAIDAAYTAAKGVFANYMSPVQANKYERYSLLGKKEHYREWLLWLPLWPGNFFNSHFGVGNIVVHLRTSVRRNEDGYTMLLVDEIQSDWHALGRDYGYLEDESYASSESDAVPDAPFIKEWHEMGIKIAIWLAVNSGISTVGFTTGKTQCERWGEFSGLRMLYDDLIPKALHKLVNRVGGYVYLADIPVRKPEGDIVPHGQMGWEILAPGNPEKRKIVRNEVVAMRYWQAGVETTQEEVIALDISPELASLVKTKGIPLFGWWHAT